MGAEEGVGVFLHEGDAEFEDGAVEAFAEDEVVDAQDELQREAVGEEGEEPLGGVERGADAAFVEMVAEGWLDVFEESLELVEVEVEAGHILCEHVAEVVVVHKADEEAEGFFLGHLLNGSIFRWTRESGYFLTLKSNGITMKFMP